MTDKGSPDRDEREQEVASDEATAERDQERPVKRAIDDRVDHEETREHPMRNS